MNSDLSVWAQPASYVSKLAALLGKICQASVTVLFDDLKVALRCFKKTLFSIFCRAQWLEALLLKLDISQSDTRDVRHVF